MILKHSDKLSRKIILEKLLNLKKSGGNLSEYDLDAMIMYFSPSVPKIPKTSFDWVSKAVAGPSDVRFYLKYVFVSSGEMAATDGHRLHMAKTDLPDGFYEPKTGIRIEVDAKYPEYKRIIPKSSSLRPAPSESYTGVQGKQFYKKIGPASVNPEYLNDAGGTVAFIGENLVTGSCSFGDFIIMGMRTK